MGGRKISHSVRTQLRIVYILHEGPRVHAAREHRAEPRNLEARKAPPRTRNCPAPAVS